jgi:hypothetical protein
MNQQTQIPIEAELQKQMVKPQIHSYSAYLNWRFAVVSRTKAAEFIGE